MAQAYPRIVEGIPWSINAKTCLLLVLKMGRNSKSHWSFILSGTRWL